MTKNKKLKLTKSERISKLCSLILSGATSEADGYALALGYDRITAKFFEDAIRSEGLTQEIIDTIKEYYKGG